jgi:hypothetical protein
MKPDKIYQEEESHTVAWLAGLSLALGILVSRIFFLLAAIIVLIVPVRRLVQYLSELEERVLSHRHV